MNEKTDVETRKENEKIILNNASKFNCAVCLTRNAGNYTPNTAKTMVLGTLVCSLINHIDIAIEWASGEGMV